MIPFINRYENIQISVQTDKVTDIPCGILIKHFISKIQTII